MITNCFCHILMHYSERMNSFSSLVQRSGVSQLGTENTMAVKSAFFLSLFERAFHYSKTIFPKCFITVQRVRWHSTRSLEKWHHFQDLNLTWFHIMTVMTCIFGEGELTGCNKNKCMELCIRYLLRNRTLHVLNWFVVVKGEVNCSLDSMNHERQVKVNHVLK